MIIPWSVDVPRDRLPYMNWFIILATIVVFALQVSDQANVQTQPHPNIDETPESVSNDEIETVAEEEQKAEEEAQTITDLLILDGWSIKGLFGYMWLHGGLLHLLGNMWFLLVFGNAVCAKIGNFRFLLMYVLFGVVAGFAHLLFNGAPALGASGAINGVVGMYLVLFPENGITCYFWFLLFILKRFVVRSCWMILFWLFWDIVGAFGGSDSGIAYFAHLGGFAAGFGIAWLMCVKGWVIMEKYEKSLLQFWKEHTSSRNNEQRLTK